MLPSAGQAQSIFKCIFPFCSSLAKSIKVQVCKCGYVHNNTCLVEQSMFRTISKQAVGMQRIKPFYIQPNLLFHSFAFQVLTSHNCTAYGWKFLKVHCEEVTDGHRPKEVTPQRLFNRTANSYTERMFGRWKRC